MTTCGMALRAFENFTAMLRYNIASKAAIVHKFSSVEETTDFAGVKIHSCDVLATLARRLLTVRPKSHKFTHNRCLRYWKTVSFDFHTGFAFDKAQKLTPARNDRYAWIIRKTPEVPPSKSRHSMKRNRKWTLKHLLQVKLLLLVELARPTGRRARSALPFSRHGTGSDEIFTPSRKEHVFEEMTVL